MLTREDGLDVPAQNEVNSAIYSQSNENEGHGCDFFFQCIVPYQMPLSANAHVFKLTDYETTNTERRREEYTLHGRNRKNDQSHLKLAYCTQPVKNILCRGVMV